MVSGTRCVVQRAMLRDDELLSTPLQERNFTFLYLTQQGAISIFSLWIPRSRTRSQNAKGYVKEKEPLAAKTSIQQVFFKSCWLSSVQRLSVEQSDAARDLVEALTTCLRVLLFE